MSEVQSIIISKNRYRTLIDAKRKVRSLGFKAVKVDEKANTYRFRQRSPNQFDRMRVKQIAPGVKLVIGFKDEGFVSAAGFLDEMTRYFRGWIMAFHGTRVNMPPAVREILEKPEVINNPIQHMKVCRRPIQKAFGAVNWVIEKLAQRPHDRLFHLFFVIDIANVPKLIVEKNESINVHIYEMKPIDDCRAIPEGVLEQKKITLPVLLERTRQKIGDERFFHYSALNYNCQRFVADVLDANGLNTPDLNKFVLQDVNKLLPVWAENLTQAATDAANRLGLVLHGEGVLWDDLSAR